MKSKQFFKEHCNYFPDIGLMYQLAPYVQNFFPKFKSKVKNTFVLSPMGSSLFGLYFHDDVAYLGVQKDIFKYFDGIYLSSCTLVENESALNIIFYMGTDDSSEEKSLRIWKHPDLIKQLEQYSNIQIIPMNSQGEVFEDDLFENIDCDIKRVNYRYWEED